MDGLILIRQAEAAGLTVLADGDKLVIRGPRMGELLAKQLLANKPLVMAVLKGSPEEDVTTTNWAADARKVIAQFTDPALRFDFTDHYEETAAKLEHEQGHPRQTAEMLAFGELLAEILRRGINVKAATRPLATGKRGESDGSKP